MILPVASQIGLLECLAMSNGSDAQFRAVQYAVEHPAVELPGSVTLVGLITKDVACAVPFRLYLSVESGT
jgi:hypothetical protein